MAFVVLAIGRWVFGPRPQSRRPVAAFTRSAPRACTPPGPPTVTVASRAAAAAGADGARKAKAATMPTAARLPAGRRDGRPGYPASSGPRARPADPNTPTP